MNCMKENHYTGCCCESSYSTNIFSKKKKIEVLKHYIECLDEKKKDIQEAINELNEK